MANRRAIVKRRKAAGNIKKITRTMQMIATARFQAALNKATASRPYTDQLAQLVANLSEVTEDFQHELMETHGGEGKSDLLVLTANRGLCGGYNANVLRAAVEHRAAQRKAGKDVEITMVGQKGISNFNFRDIPMRETLTHIDDQPRFDQVEPIAEALMERFLSGEVAETHVAYMRFYSAGDQRPEIFKLLPLAQLGEGDGGEPDDETGEEDRVRAQFEIRPSAPELLDELLPMTVRMRLFQSFNDATVSEQIARMAAMKAATEAAEEMIQNLTRQYNRARQTAITMELLDIVGGADALS